MRGFEHDFAGLVTLAEDLQGRELFFSHVHLHGGPAPVRQYLPDLIDLIWHRRINPGKVFDLELPLEQAAEGYKAMDERRAVEQDLVATSRDVEGRRLGSVSARLR